MTEPTESVSEAVSLVRLEKNAIVAIVTTTVLEGRVTDVVISA